MIEADHRNFDLRGFLWWDAEEATATTAATTADATPTAATNGLLLAAASR